ncbi:MAG: hypothetical protein H0Z39_03365 [Peptococcaceae bacterium]|nr:hypothetical protein [Peptococcaceae bacterium]
MPVLRVNILPDDYKHLPDVDKVVTRYGGRLGKPQPSSFKTDKVHEGWAVDIFLPDRVNIHEFTREITSICCVYLPQQRRRSRLIWYVLAMALLLVLPCAAWYYLGKQ